MIVDCRMESFDISSVFRTLDRWNCRTSDISDRAWFVWVCPPRPGFPVFTERKAWASMYISNIEIIRIAFFFVPRYRSYRVRFWIDIPFYFYISTGACLLCEYFRFQGQQAGGYRICQVVASAHISLLFLCWAPLVIRSSCQLNCQVSPIKHRYEGARGLTPSLTAPIHYTNNILHLRIILIIYNPSGTQNFRGGTDYLKLVLELFRGRNI